MGFNFGIGGGESTASDSRQQADNQSQAARADILNPYSSKAVGNSRLATPGSVLVSDKGVLTLPGGINLTGLKEFTGAINVSTGVDPAVLENFFEAQSIKSTKSSVADQVKDKVDSIKDFLFETGADGTQSPKFIVWIIGGLAVFALLMFRKR